MGMIGRRNLLAAGAASALAACATPARGVLAPPRKPVAPVLMRADRIDRITVCLRPFRAAGPRIEGERLCEKWVVHNYGHGGAGWSLSWGSSAIAVREALSAPARDIAVIGCGALGLTTASLLLREGANVTIYAKDLPQDSRSARATGTWSPDSRIALTSAAGPDFPARWEAMARASHAAHSAFLGPREAPVTWLDWYGLSDAPNPRRASRDFAELDGRLRDLSQPGQTLSRAENPFPTATARRSRSMVFNIAIYAQRLLDDVRRAGARVEIAEFHEPADILRLPHETIVNCTGYGARALWRDESIIPVRGQIAWLIPQPEVQYALHYRNILVVSRADGIVVQQAGTSDDWGYGDDREIVDRSEALAAMATVAPLFRGMR
ncbi:MAG: FAD-dependent oxidoreductase [Alphaproteobacteria bacterium]|nr:FAD-dependent oxidoreductase [Alphaproteobacteria bacterium]